MAPEQIQGKKVDGRTDIFAFGAVLFEMLTGKKPFEAEGNAGLMAAILEREPPPLSGLQPLATPALERLVRTCLAKGPDDRWQTARDLLRELQWLADTDAVRRGARRTPARPVSKRSLSEPRRRRQAWQQQPQHHEQQTGRDGRALAPGPGIGVLQRVNLTGGIGGNENAHAEGKRAMARNSAARR
jgi:serine/threonine protein kinase